MSIIDLNTCLMISPDDHVERLEKDLVDDGSKRYRWVWLCGLYY